MVLTIFILSLFSLPHVRLTKLLIAGIIHV